MVTAAQSIAFPAFVSAPMLPISLGGMNIVVAPCPAFLALSPPGILSPFQPRLSRPLRAAFGSFSVPSENKDFNVVDDMRPSGGPSKVLVVDDVYTLGGGPAFSPGPSAPGAVALEAAAVSPVPLAETSATVAATATGIAITPPETIGAAPPAALPPAISGPAATETDAAATAAASVSPPAAGVAPAAAPAAVDGAATASDAPPAAVPSPTVASDAVAAPPVADAAKPASSGAAASTSTPANATPEKKNGRGRGKVENVEYDLNTEKVTKKIKKVKVEKEPEKDLEEKAKKKAEKVLEEKAKKKAEQDLKEEAKKKAGEDLKEEKKKKAEKILEEKTKKKAEQDLKGEAKKKAEKDLKEEKKKKAEKDLEEKTKKAEKDLEEKTKKKEEKEKKDKEKADEKSEKRAERKPPPPRKPKPNSNSAAVENKDGDNAVPAGLALGAAPLAAAPILLLGLPALREALRRTKLRRGDIQDRIDDVSSGDFVDLGATRAVAPKTDEDEESINNALAFIGAAIGFLGLILTTTNG